MKTMRRIDQPLQFEQPVALKNSLLEIQQHYQQIVKHIDYFDYEVVEIRKQIANEFLAREREKQEDALRRARGHEKNSFWFQSHMTSSDESDQEQPTQERRRRSTRRRRASYRFNIASTNEAFYQK